MHSHLYEDTWSTQDRRDTSFYSSPANARNMRLLLYTLPRYRHDTDRLDIAIMNEANKHCVVRLRRDLWAGLK